MGFLARVELSETYAFSLSLFWIRLSTSLPAAPPVLPLWSPVVLHIEAEEPSGIESQKCMQGYAWFTQG